MRHPRLRAVSAPDRDVDDERDQLRAWIAGEGDEPRAVDALPPERFSVPARRPDDRDDDATTRFLRDPTWGDLAGLLEPDAFPSESLPSVNAPAGRSWRPSLTAKDFAIEVSAMRSIPPRLAAWSRSMWFVPPMLGALAAGILWGPRPADVFTLAAYMSEPVVRFVSLRAPAMPAQSAAANQVPEPIVPEPIRPDPITPKPIAPEPVAPPTPVEVHDEAPPELAPIEPTRAIAPRVRKSHKRLAARKAAQATRAFATGSDASSLP